MQKQSNHPIVFIKEHFIELVWVFMGEEDAQVEIL